MKYVVAAAMAGVLVWCSPAIVHADRVQTEFKTVFGDREARYVGEQRASLEKRDAAKASYETASSRNDPAQDSGRYAHNELVRATIGLGYANGRLASLKDFDVFFAKRPSITSIDLFMQERVSNLQRMAQASKDQVASLNGADPKSVQDFVGKAFAAMQYSGFVQGYGDETRLIDQNLEVYSTAERNASNRRRDAVSAILSGLSSGATQYSNSLQSRAFQAPTTTRCVSNPGNVTCTTQ
ncbi:hypothetical protein GCM10008023_05670 [Sphingomonas glacialis]|uniref:DUF4142 domain-containing protein n=1 Tax=Sphingomonas glacialis TaxID=658225 RepID=A0ABQ3LAB1_9SPHN|nr:hypothetical protein [Sphingomonas glacialis]GHH09250.1 hypothetical protein GCM10008023_05670 [Sphingomonas glacialis]